MVLNTVTVVGSLVVRRDHLVNDTGIVVDVTVLERRLVVTGQLRDSVDSIVLLLSLILVSLMMIVVLAVVGSVFVMGRNAVHMSSGSVSFKHLVVVLGSR